MIKPRASLDHLTLYVPGKSIEEVVQEFGLTDVIKMASNENPLGCPVSPTHLEGILKKSHFYPHQASSGLIQALCEKFQISENQVILGNGSDEVILFLGMAYLDPGDEVITSEYTFSEYEFATKVMGARFITVPMTAGYKIDLEGYLSALTPQTKMMFIANPNNPTGTMVTRVQLNAFLAKVPSHVLVVLDEAYAEYATNPDFASGLEWLNRHSNVIVLRTFSKLYGLAGFRIGYGMGHADVIATLQKVRPPFNVNSVALAAATLALKNKDFVRRSLEVNAEGHAFLAKALTEKGLTVLPSEANFLCVFIPDKAKIVADRLQKKGIIVRSLHGFGLETAIRVTVGLREQNQRFLDHF